MKRETILNWKKQLARRLSNYNDLQSAAQSSGIEIPAELTENMTEWFAAVEGGRPDFLPFLTTEYYLKAALAAGPGEREAVLRQIIPDAREFQVREYELSDPLGEARYSPHPRMVHRYPDRALILVTDECAMFCRHCFRRSFTGGMNGPLKDSELKPILKYFAGHPEIHEVLLTGGDPLTLSDERLKSIISRIRNVRPDLTIRLCSRIPVVLPGRITNEFADMIADFDNLWFITHYNHPAELSPESIRAVGRIRKAGVPLLNQTVLLRGVNDDVDTLSGLFRKLLAAGVKPYYLFQGDLAAGTSHLRVPLEEALRLTGELKDKISGMAMPRFAVDLPGGGGKITLPSECHSIERKGDYYIVKGFDNEQYRYPAN